MVEVVQPLLKQLADVKSLLATYKGDQFSATNELFPKIEGDVKFIKDVFLRLERWEREIKDEIGVVARHLDDVLEYHKSNAWELQSSLTIVNQKVSDLKERMTPTLQLQPASTCSSPTAAIEKHQQVEYVNNVATDLWLSHSLAAASISPLITVKDKFIHTLTECIRPLVMFPDDAMINKRQLTYWWLAEDLVSSLEAESEACIIGLIDVHLIRPIYRYHNLTVQSLMMQPRSRNNLISLAQIDGIVRLNAREGINVHQQYLKFNRKSFMEMRNATILQLGRWQSSAKHHIEVEDTQFLEWLRFFKKLRYFSLRGISRITELPASICELTSLIILDLRACHNLQRLPVEITMLKKLKHLDVSECYLLDHMPKGLSSLEELEVLKGFVIGSSRSQDPCRLSELAKLEKLRKLSISIGSDQATVEGELNELGKFRALRSLTITWGLLITPSNQARLSMSMVTRITPFLSPPLNLEKLDLRCFPRDTASQWLIPSKLSNLKKLYIRGGSLRSLAGPKGSTEYGMWNVSVLRLKFLREFYMGGAELRSMFPHLAYLEIHECNKQTSTTLRLRDCIYEKLYLYDDLKWIN